MPNPANNYLTFAFQLPDPNLDQFIVVCGEAGLGICNVKDGSYISLINAQMSVGQPGIQGAFAKTEDYGLSVHFTNRVTDT